MDAIEGDQPCVVLAQELAERQPGGVLAPAGDRPGGDHSQRVLIEVGAQLRRVVVEPAERRRDQDESGGRTDPDNRQGSGGADEPRGY